MSSSWLHYGVKVAAVAALLALPLAPPEALDFGTVLGLSRWALAALFAVVLLAAAAWDTTLAVLVAILLMAALVRGGPL